MLTAINSFPGKSIFRKHTYFYSVLRQRNGFTLVRCPSRDLIAMFVMFAVMNNYQAAAAGFGPPASPHGAGGRAGFPSASSPGPALDVYGSAADSVGYVQAASPQPSGFPAIAVSRAPLNYTPVRHYYIPY